MPDPSPSYSTYKNIETTFAFSPLYLILIIIVIINVLMKKGLSLFHAFNMSIYIMS